MSARVPVALPTAPIGFHADPLDVRLKLRKISEHRPTARQLAAKHFHSQLISLRESALTNGSLSQIEPIQLEQGVSRETLAVQLMPATPAQFSRFMALSSHTFLSKWQTDSHENCLSRLSSLTAFHGCHILTSAAAPMLSTKPPEQVPQRELSNLLLSAQTLARSIGANLVSAYFQTEAGHVSVEQIDNAVVVVETNGTTINEVVALRSLIRTLIR